MPRVVSFIVLLASIMLLGSMFFQVMLQFIVPLFLAAVMVVVFKPLHLWMLERCGPRPRTTAALTTLTIVLLVLLPICGLIVRAVREGAAIYDHYISNSDAAVPVAVLPPEPVDSLEVGEEESKPLPDKEAVSIVISRFVEAVNPLLEKIHLPTYEGEEVQDYLVQQLQEFAAPLAVGGVKLLGSTLVGLAIMCLTMYYFFSDGPSMISALKRLSPLEDEYEQELLDKFGDISRAVVVATLASAIVQGILAGIGYWFAGMNMVFLLTALTAFMSMVPFVGATIIWIPICIFLYYYDGNPAYPDGRPVAALVLALYCLGVVSTIDNVIKPWVLHGQSKLHPLLALLSVIGGVQALGPIGILVGPMLIAFLQALLNMLNKELHLLGQEADTHGTPVVFATSVEQDGKALSPTDKPAAKKSRKEKK